MIYYKGENIQLFVKTEQYIDMSIKERKNTKKRVLGTNSKTEENI